MQSMRRLLSTLIPIVLALPASADVTIEQTVKSGGMRGMGAYEGAMRRVVAKDRSRSENEMRFTGAVMKRLAGERDGVDIVRLDKDVVWTLNPAKKTYSEHPVALPPMPETKPTASDPAGGKNEKPTHRIKKSTFDVKKTGQKKDVNGFKTQETQLLATVEVEEIATGFVTTSRWDTRLWLAPWTADLKKASQEEAAFFKAYAAKLTGGQPGSPNKPGMSGAQIRMLLGLSEADADKMAKTFAQKAAALDGYPIVTDSSWFVDEDPRAKAARKEQASAKDEGSSPQLSADPKAMAGNLMAGFAKKKMKERQEKAEQEREGKPVFSVYSEIKSVSLAAAAPALFEVPAGFKKISR